MTAILVDTNMVPGHTYTLSFKLNNIFTQPSQGTIVNDLQNWGPQYASSVNPKWIGTWNPFLNILAVTFTYSGDGSDVISDAGQEFVQAFTQGSNDSFDFQGADDGSTSSAGGGTGDVPDPGAKPKCGIDNLAACFPDTGTTTILVVAGVVILLAVAFLSPGGQALAVTRSAK